jgi:hypothetical protein
VSLVSIWYQLGIFTENLATIREYLKENAVQELNTVDTRKDGRKLGNNQIEELGSVRNIYNWLGKNGEVISLGKISEFLKVHDNLDRRLLRNTKDSSGGTIDDGKLSIEDAKILARIDKKDQFVLKGLLDETGLATKNKSKLVTLYNLSSEEIKEMVKSGDVLLTEIKDKTEIQKQKEAYEEATKSDDEGIKVLRTSEIINNLRSEIVEANKDISRFISKVRTVRFHKLSWENPNQQRDFAKFIDSSLSRTKKWAEQLERIQLEVGI